MTIEATERTGIGLGRGGRMSRKRKRDAVLRLLRGEDLEILSRALGVTAATLSGWQDTFVAVGEASLALDWKSRSRSTGTRKPGYAVHRRRGAGERAPEGEAGRDAARARTAGRQDRCSGGQPPFGPPEVAAMSRTVSPSSGRPYGLARVWRVWRAARASVYRHLSSSRPEPPRRPGPVGPMPDAALLEAIRAVLGASPFHGEGHRKVWARLRVAGVRTSKRRVLRLMRANNLLAPSRVGAPRGPRNHDGTIIPDTVDTMWGTGLTTTLTGEGQVAVFVAVDHCSAECVGIHAARRATRF